MLEKNARVLEIRDDCVVVETSRQPGCDGCGAQTACGAGLLSQLFRAKPARFIVKRAPGLEVGHEVVIAIPESGVLKSAFLVYVLPLLGMFLFAMLAEVVFAPAGEASMIFTGALGFLLTLGWVRWRYRHAGRDAAFQPVIVRQKIALRPST